MKGFRKPKKANKGQQEIAFNSVVDRLKISESDMDYLMGNNTRATRQFRAIYNTHVSFVGQRGKTFEALQHAFKVVKWERRLAPVWIFAKCLAGAALVVGVIYVANYVSKI